MDFLGERNIGALIAIVALVSQAAAIEEGVESSVRLQVGGRFLNIDVSTVAPVVVYDGAYYRRTVESVSLLVKTVKEVPQITAVAVPAGASEIVLNGTLYPVESATVARTIEVVTGTVQKVIYEPQAVQTTVYVPTDPATTVGAAYIVPSEVRTSWVQVGGVVIVEGGVRPRFLPCAAPVGVVVVDGFWRGLAAAVAVSSPPKPFPPAPPVARPGPPRKQGPFDGRRPHDR